MTVEEIQTALDVLDQRERLIFRMGVFNGIRPDEILAVRLGNIGEESILIDQRVHKGDIDTPKVEKETGRRERSGSRRARWLSSRYGARCCPIRSRTLTCFRPSETLR